ncbi:hypothetical protein MAHJHV61_50600 [Mycobacterium avium subsp. hominissuis]
MLKELLAERGVYDYASFRAEYRRAAMELKPSEPVVVPVRSTFHRWCNGDLRKLPHEYHCDVLEYMFPGWKARDLFSSRTDRRSRAAAAGRPALLAPIAATITAEELAGLWVTAYAYLDRRHADLSVVTVAGADAVTVRNWPPEPRLEGATVGYRNEIEASVVGRQLVGTWRNCVDRYYYGTVHVAAHPGASMLEGYYTSIVNDIDISSGRWRWVRIDPRSAAGTELSRVELQEPAIVHDVVMNRDPNSGSMRLDDVVQGRGGR